MLLVLLLLLAGFAAAAPAAAQSNERCFEETGYCISGPIRAYWEGNGGLPVFGYPITEQRVETVEDRTIPVQWFERDRLEIQNDGTVTAGRLGARYLELTGRPWTTLPQVPAAPPGCVYFEQTQHSLCPPFLAYWQQNGGLERFGYPITERQQETIEGWTGDVQYFERRRMEHHIENAGTPYEVLLGLLGRDVLNYEQQTTLDTSGQIAFTSSRTGNKEIWVMSGSGANPRQVTNNPGADDFQPAWSPDGSQITYVVGTEATQNQDIWVVNTDGSGARKLSESSAAEWEPAWSPDGSRIAFVSDREGDADIFIRNADGSGEDFNLTAYAPDSAQYSPAWSPDGTRIAYISTENGSPSLWVMTVDGSERNQLHTGGILNYPNWTPDSARIVFQASSGLSIINSDGQNYQPLWGTYQGTHPTVSPNGSTVAYESAEGDIIIADLGDNESRNLTNSPGSVDQDPDWR
jgi:hypothetical protein